MPQASAEETLHRKKTLSRERIVVGVMVVCFLIAGVWMQHNGHCWRPSEESLRAVRATEQVEIVNGLYGQFSPLTTGYLLLYKPFGLPHCVIGSGELSADMDTFRSLPQRIVFLIAAALLGLSMAFVVKKFFGGRAALIASSLYFTSPVVMYFVLYCNPAALAAWGSYGVIFTSIATAHTLYAPREVILWNWKRILMLGCSIALAVGAMPILVFLTLLAFALMIWVAPHRWRAATAIMGCGIGVAVMLLGILAFLLPTDYWRMAQDMGWLQWPVFGFTVGDPRAEGWLLPSMLLCAPYWLALAALGVFCCWRRTRFFGNWAPLSIGLIFIAAVGVNACGVDSFSFLLCALPFLLTFLVGVEADMAEKGWRREGNIVMALVVSVQLVLIVFFSVLP